MFSVRDVFKNETSQNILIKNSPVQADGGVYHISCLDVTIVILGIQADHWKLLAKHRYSINIHGHNF